MVAIMQERPPYIRFEIRSMERRDNDGVAHPYDAELILVTPAGSKDVHEAIADEWISNKERLARMEPPQYHPEWANRFRSSFELWRKGHAIPEFGVPIRSWPALSPSEVKRCLDANVLTVEDLAAANEPTLARLGMGSRTLKMTAMAWMEDADRSKAAQKTAALELANGELCAQVERLQSDMKKLSDALADATDAPRRRKGRPEIEQSDAIQ